jgi:hypothetical protein
MLSKSDVPIGMELSFDNQNVTLYLVLEAERGKTEKIRSN